MMIICQPGCTFDFDSEGLCFAGDDCEITLTQSSLYDTHNLSDQGLSVDILSLPDFSEYLEVDQKTDSLTRSEDAVVYDVDPIDTADCCFDIEQPLDVEDSDTEETDLTEDSLIPDSTADVGAIDASVDVWQECEPGIFESCGESEIGECEYGIRTCQDNGIWSNCIDSVGPSTELCNDLDDDCDESVDEDFPTLGEHCVLGLGECQASGVFVCFDDQVSVVCDAVPFPSEEELCDELDNDCDGSVDEGCECIPDSVQSCGTSDVGNCEFGVQLCLANGTWGQCEGAVESTEEVCNDQDDNCNGDIDEGVLNLCGSCGEVPVESCNKQDDDCDGQTDEDFPNLGQPCVVGVGECEAEGLMVCSEDEQSELCGVEPGEPTEEVCDGLDNNCNEQVDEGVLNACGDCGDVPVETCNNKDDDCDEQVDEDFVNLGIACSIGLGECLSEGVLVCSSDGDEETCNAVFIEATEEVCDGLDNNCNGDIDEGLTNACGGCGPLPIETCNGEDDNCNGQTDEGCECLPGETEQCGITNVGKCKFGTKPCSPDGTWGDCQGAVAPVPEICNNKDDDCDGQVDNSVLNACGSCGAVPEEVCNGLDDDCDEQIDENWPNKYYEPTEGSCIFTPCCDIERLWTLHTKTVGQSGWSHFNLDLNQDQAVIDGTLQLVDGGVVSNCEGLLTKQNLELACDNADYSFTFVSSQTSEVFATGTYIKVYSAGGTETEMFDME
jgi:hypothetical protein